MVKTIVSLLEYTIELWNNRCNTLHGATDAEKKQICHDKVSEQIENKYTYKEKVNAFSGKM